MRALLVSLLLVSALVAGCSGSEPEPTDTTTDRPPVAPDRGAISGLLIDDIYRPVAGGRILLQGAGLTATTDAQGQFTFVDLVPGTFIAIANAAGHEAAPVNVDVTAGVYTDLEIVMRRIFSQEGSIVTTQYSVFVPCSVSSIQGTSTLDCTGDQSHESFRAGFTSNYTGYKDATYLVTEMKSNHKASSSQGAYKVVVRELGACNAATCSGDYWGSKFITEGDYLKITLQIGNVSADDTEARNVAWDNTKQMETFLFPQGAFKSESQGVLDAQCSASGQCFESRGLGPQVGVKANFVQSLFLGEPKVDIGTYQVLHPSE